MKTAAERAEQTVAAIKAKIPLSHNEQAIVAIIISQAIEADRKDHCLCAERKATNK